MTIKNNLTAVLWSDLDFTIGDSLIKTLNGSKFDITGKNGRYQVNVDFKFRPEKFPTYQFFGQVQIRDCLVTFEVGTHEFYSNITIFYAPSNARGSKLELYKPAGINPGGFYLGPNVNVNIQEKSIFSVDEVGTIESGVSFLGKGSLNFRKSMEVPRGVIASNDLTFGVFANASITLASNINANLFIQTGTVRIESGGIYTAKKIAIESGGRLELLTAIF